MSIFYAPNIKECDILDEEESNHIAKVLRMDAGAEIELIDGKGGYYLAEIVSPHPKRTKFRIIKEEQGFGAIPYRLHIAVAPTKNIDRIEWFVEKATEIGISEISMLICDRSERRIVKCERLEKILISAAKQSRKAFVPVINDAVPFKSFVSENRSGELYIAHCIESEKFLLSKSVKAGQEITVLIGPEGDFTPDEVNLAMSVGFKPVSLGECRLRTETAALAATHTVAVINELSL